MLIKVKRIFYKNNYSDSRISMYAAIVLIICVGRPIHIMYQNISNSTDSSDIANVTIAARIRISVCNTSPVNCRCSDSSNSSIQCVPDIEMMVTHVLPLVIYVLELYFVYQMFSFTGNYKHMLTDIFWAASMFIFIYLLIDIHGTSLLHQFITAIISLSGAYVSFYIMMFTKSMQESNSSEEIPENYRERESRL